MKKSTIIFAALFLMNILKSSASGAAHVEQQFAEQSHIFDIPFEADLVAGLHNNKIAFAKKDHSTIGFLDITDKTCELTQAAFAQDQKEVSDPQLHKLARTGDNTLKPLWSTKCRLCQTRSYPVALLPDKSQLYLRTIYQEIIRYSGGLGYLDGDQKAVHILRHAKEDQSACGCKEKNRLAQSVVDSEPVDIVYDSNTAVTYIYEEHSPFLMARSFLGEHNAGLHLDSKGGTYCSSRELVKLAVTSDSIIVAGDRQVQFWSKANPRNTTHTFAQKKIRAIANFPESAPEELVISTGKQLEVRYKKPAVLAALREAFSK